MVRFFVNKRAPVIPMPNDIRRRKDRRRRNDSGQRTGGPPDRQQSPPSHQAEVEKLLVEVGDGLDHHGSEQVLLRRDQLGVQRRTRTLDQHIASLPVPEDGKTTKSEAGKKGKGGGGGGGLQLECISNILLNLGLGPYRYSPLE